MAQIVPALDLRDNRSAPDAGTVVGMPSNIEAEQALLGILLYDAEAAAGMPDQLGPSDFYEPVHGLIYGSIMSASAHGTRADPITLAEEFRASAGFKTMGGVSYLVDMVDRAPPGANAGDYAAVIIELSLRRRLIRLGGELARAADSADMSSGGATGIIAEAESALLAMSISDRRMELVDAASAADAVLAWVDDHEHQTGTLTGLGPLDRVLGPLLDGDLVLVGGRPGMGKSALASDIALRVADPAWWAHYLSGKYIEPQRHILAGLPRPKGVIEINGEMSVEQMTRRHLSDICFAMYGDQAPTYKAIRDKRVSVEQRKMLDEAAAIFRQLPIKMLKRTGLRISQLRSIVRRQVGVWAREGVDCGLVIVDHVGLLRPEGRSQGRYSDQQEIAIGMKELAGELRCPVMALVQLSREVERRDDKRPTLADLRDAGGWEENADAVLFPFRPAYYALREEEPDAGDMLKWNAWDQARKSMDIEIIVAKLREGEAGTDPVLWGAMGWNAIRGMAPNSVDLI